MRIDSYPRRTFFNQAKDAFAEDNGEETFMPPDVTFHIDCSLPTAGNQFIPKRTGKISCKRLFDPVCQDEKRDLGRVGHVNGRNPLDNGGVSICLYKSVFKVRASRAKKTSSDYLQNT